MLRIGICDDVAETVEYHANMIRRIMCQMSLKADIRKCYTGNELLIEMEDSGNFHLILLDIEMENMNGIETARRIRILDHYVVLIFVTAYEQYSRQAIEVNRIWHSIALKDIYYFKSELRKICIVGNQPEQWFYGRMDKVEEILKNKRHMFLRIHKSFIVNCRYIARYSYEKVVLRNGEELEISRANRSMGRKFYLKMPDGET